MDLKPIHLCLFYTFFFSLPAMNLHLKGFFSLPAASGGTLGGGGGGARLSQIVLLLRKVSCLPCDEASAGVPQMMKKKKEVEEEHHLVGNWTFALFHCLLSSLLIFGVLPLMGLSR